MTRSLIATLVFALALAPLWQSVALADKPPVSGTVRNFEVRDRPVPTPQTPFQADRDQTRTLAEFRGRVILVNFWATWCLGSQRELPTLERLQAKLGGDRFTVVLMSEDLDGWDVVEPFLKQAGITNREVYLDVGLSLGKAIELPPQMGSISTASHPGLG